MTAGAESLGVAILDLSVNPAGMQSGMTVARRDAEGWADTTGASMSTRLSKGLAGTGKSLTKYLTVPIAGVGLAAAKLATDFQASMERIHTQAGASQTAVKGLSDQVLQLAKTMPQSPDELAQGLYHLYSAGFRGAQAMDMLRASAKLAAIGNANLEDTTQAVIATMASGIKGISGASQAMSGLNAIVGTGDMKMQALVTAMATGIMPSARSAGLSFQDVGAALATLTDNAQQAAPAATHLRMTISMMAAPTATAAKALASVGIGSTQLADDMRKPDGLLVAIQDLRQHLEDSGKSASEQNAVLARAFGGGRSSAAILTLIEEIGRLGSKYQEQKKLMDPKTVDDAWAQFQKTQDARLKEMESSLEVSAIQVGQALLPVIVPVLQKAVHAVTGLGQAFANLPAPVKSVIVVAGLAAAALGPILKIGGALISSFQTLGSVLSTIASGAMSLVTGAVRGLTAAFGFLTDGLLTTRIGLAALKVQEIAQAIASKAAAAATAVWSAATKVATVAQEAWNAIMDANPIMLVVGALALLIPAIVEVADHWSFVEGILKAGWAWIESASVAVFNAVKTVIVTAWQVIEAITLAVWNGVIKPGLQLVWDVIKAIATTYFDIYRQIIETAWNVIRTITTAVWNAIKDVLMAVWEVIKSVVTTEINAVRAVITTVWNAISSVTSSIWSAIESAVGGAIHGVLSVVKTVVNTLEGWLNSAWKSISNGVASFATTIKNSVVSAFTGAVNVVIGFVNDIIGVIDKIPGVHIGKIKPIGGSSGSGSSPSASSPSKGPTVGGHTYGTAATGGMMINHPMWMVGEEAPTHPEVVIATNPAYRQRNMGLWAEAGKRLGVRGFASGGILGDVGSVVSSIGSGITSAAGAVGTAVSDASGFVTDMLSKGASWVIGQLPGVGSLPSWLAGMGSQVLTDVGNWIKNKVGGFVSSVLGGGGDGGGGRGGGSPAGLSGSLISMLNTEAKRMGWDASQVADWERVINAESGGSFTILGVPTIPGNNTPGISRAFGLGQFLGGTFTEYLGKYGGIAATPAEQVLAMAEYIRNSYGTPANAWAHEQSAHWYAKGGILGFPTGHPVASPMLPYAGSYDGGGTVPGPVGKPWWAVVHGGEQIGRGSSGGDVVVQGDLVVQDQQDANQLASRFAWRLQTG